MNKNITILILLGFLSMVCNAQTNSEIDAIVDKFPKKIRTIDEVSFLIRQNFNSDSSKARGIYRYISNSLDENK